MLWKPGTSAPGDTPAYSSGWIRPNRLPVACASRATSAVAPLWAALTSRLAEAAGQRFGLIQTLLYAGVTPGTAMPGFQDITSGNNGAYAAGPGWDACSGLGSPDGTALLTRLRA